jgi:hypothetical protein
MLRPPELVTPHLVAHEVACKRTIIQMHTPRKASELKANARWTTPSLLRRHTPPTSTQEQLLVSFLSGLQSAAC